LKENYSSIKEITILDNSNSANNTFNTFWKDIEINGNYSDKLKAIKQLKVKKN
jgi:hypothetical protein